MRTTLAKLLLTLAATHAALGGCHAKSANPRPDERAVEREAVDPALAEEVSGAEAKDSAAAGVASTPAPPPNASPMREAKEGEKHPAPSAKRQQGYAGGLAATGRGAARHDDATTTETYRDYGVNAWVETARDKLSTFAADVDTASYTIARRKLTEGALPPTAAVRVEEFVNYFEYGYAPPDGARPFAVHIDAAPSPFHAGRHVVRVGVTTKAKAATERKPANLVFLVDVSGSMAPPDRLALAKRSLRILVENLRDDDTVSLVTYAGSTRVVLEPTGGADKDRILAAIEDLDAGGSTAMASGIELAYAQAAKRNKGDTISRVIVLSDGDANVGTTSHADILKSIEGHVREGVTLSTIGFGMGNYRDETMEQLANRGNGNNYYIDGLSQAKRVFEEQLGSTLEVVAKDVKLQVEFDDRLVERYRLVGYENRDIADDDFRRDEVDAGEIGAGHQVTAIYEVELAGDRAARLAAADLLTVRVRHKAPKGTQASEAAFTMSPDGLAASFDAGSADFRFAFAVAAFAEVLRGSEDAEHWDLRRIRAIADSAAGRDADRAELVRLIDRAIELRGAPGKKTAMAR